MIKTIINRHYKTAFFLSLFVFVVSASLKLLLCINMAVKTSELREDFNLKTQLEREVIKLTYDDTSISSLGYIEIRARSLGFVESKDRVVALDTQAPIKVASLQN